MVGLLDTIPSQQPALRHCEARARHHERDRNMPAQTGKRYTCPKCGSEFIVTKGGDGDLSCDGTPLELKK